MKVRRFSEKLSRSLGILWTPAFRLDEIPFSDVFREKNRVSCASRRFRWISEQIAFHFARWHRCVASLRFQMRVVITRRSCKKLRALNPRIWTLWVILDALGRCEVPWNYVSTSSSTTVAGFEMPGNFAWVAICSHWCILPPWYTNPTFNYLDESQVRILMPWQSSASIVGIPNPFRFERQNEPSFLASK